MNNSTWRIKNALRELIDVPAKAAAPASAAIFKRLQRQFQKETDPYGNPWAPLAKSTIARKGHARILKDTLALMSGTGAKPAPGAGILVHVGPKGEYHQDGRTEPTFMPARKILPEFGLPATWREDIAKAVARAMKRR